MQTKTERKYIHTPGPWEVDSGMVQTVTEHTCKTPGCGVHIPIALMDRNPDNGTVPTERDANAYLIAASPDMFDALKDIQADWNAWDGYSRNAAEFIARMADTMTRVNAAIEKVEKYYG
jgi:hypothetical protein